VRITLKIKSITKVIRRYQITDRPLIKVLKMDMYNNTNRNISAACEVQTLK
jgi:hypothetical protein